MAKLSDLHYTGVIPEAYLKKLIAVINESSEDIGENNANIAALGEELEALINDKIAEVVGDAPENLDSLGELASAINNNDNVVEDIKDIIRNNVSTLNESINNVKSELETKIDDEISTIMGGIAPDTLDSIFEIADALENNPDILELYETKVNHDNDISNLTNTINTNKTDIENKAATIEGNIGDVSTLPTSDKTVVGSITEIKQNIDTNISDIEGKITEVTESIDTLTNNVAEQDEATLTSAKAYADSVKEALDASISTTNSNLTDAIERIDAAETSINTVNTNIGTLDNLTTDDKTVVGSINEVNADLIEITDGIKENIGILTDVDDSVESDTIVGSINSLKTYVDEQNNNLSDTIGDINSLSTENKDNVVLSINEVVTDVSTNAESITTINEKIGELESTVNDIPTTYVASASLTDNVKAIVIDDIDSVTVGNVTSYIDSQDTALDDKIGDISTLPDDATDLATAITNIDTELSDFKDEVSTTYVASASLTDDVKAIVIDDVGSVTVGTVVDHIDTKISDLVGGADKALDTLKEIGDALGNNSDAVAALTNNIANVNNKIGELDSLNTTNKTNVVISINEVNANVSKNASDISEIDTEMGNLKTSVETTIPATYATKTELESNYTDIDTRVDTIETTYAKTVDVDTKIGDLTGLSTTNKDDIVSSVNEVAQQASTNESNISGINTKIGDISTLPDDATDLATAITNIDTTVTGINGRVSVIEDDFITSTDLTDAIDAIVEEDPTVPTWVKNITEENISDWNAKSEFDGQYSSLSGTPDLSTYVTTTNLEDYALESAIPTSTSQLTNDSNFVTQADIPEVPEWVESVTITQTDIMNWNAKSDFDGTYESLSGTPTIPANVSDLNDASNYVTSTSLTGTLASYATTANLNEYVKTIDLATKVKAINLDDEGTTTIATLLTKINELEGRITALESPGA